MEYIREKYINEDSPIKNDLLKLFGNNDFIVILDIGACEGEESVRYSRIYPNSKIHAFEPLPKNQKKVKENIRKYKLDNVKLWPVAVSDFQGKTSLYKSSGHPDDNSNSDDWDFGNKSSSLLLPIEKNMPKWLEFNSKIEVETTTLAAFIALNNLNIIDFIHMDVQGAELKALSGLKEHIANVKSIWLEVSDIELYKDQPLRKDVEKYMKSKGFIRIKSVMKNNVGDQFYVNRKYFWLIRLFRKTFFIKK